MSPSPYGNTDAHPFVRRKNMRSFSTQHRSNGESPHMKTFLKIVGGLALVIVAFVIGVVSWLSIRKPASRPASAEKIEATPARLARGHYVVDYVSDCFGCHSD